jgi:serine/threonine-protein kinase PknG
MTSTPDAAHEVCATPGCGGPIEDGWCLRCGRSAAEPAAAGPDGPDADSPTVATETTRTETTRTETTRSTSGGGPAGAAAPVWRGVGAPLSRRELTELPALPPAPDDDGATTPTLLVPRHKRKCHYCHAPAPGTGSSGRPDNFCVRCGEPLSFEPPLRPGERVGRHFVVREAIAHGGQGWVYRAWHEDFEREVVLKGLVDPDDPYSVRAASEELTALASAQHPNIVRVYQRVDHTLSWRRRDGSVVERPVEYIVMDLVSGETLSQRLSSDGPMPVDLVLRYGILVLEALAHLHRLRLLYCDLSPDQVFHTRDEPPELRLVDLGGVRKFDSDDPHVWGKRFYQDPRVRRDKASPDVGTDLYTTGRMLARLCIPRECFPNHEAKGELPLPHPSVAPLLEAHDPFRRFLWRLVDPEPEGRFVSAYEAAVQAEGVLRQVISWQQGAPCPSVSTLFGPELALVGADPTTFPDADLERLALALPNLQPDPSDPHAGLLAAMGPMENADARRTLLSLADPSPESRRRAAYAGVRIGGADREAGLAELAALLTERPRDPRVHYACGIAALVDGRVRDATDRFESVLDAWPGELTPRYALGVCAESRADPGLAAAHYETVWRSDTSWIGAAFGLARCRLGLGDRAGAAHVLESVPADFRAAVIGRLCAVHAWTRDVDPHQAPEPGFFTTVDDLESDDGVLADLDERRRREVEAAVLERVLPWVENEPPPDPDPGRRTLIGRPMTGRGVRDGLEAVYRDLAVLDPSRRIEYVDLANARRNRSWW